MRLRLRKTSLLDYPGRVAAVLFVPGCNLRCPWCHNRELVLPGAGESEGPTPEEALAFLERRRPVLGGVVISGGEPCLWEGLPGFIAAVKKTGLPVKLDTNGTFPASLEKLFSRGETCPDYVALDLKLAPARYGELVPQSLNPGNALIESAALLRQSGIAHEFRTVALPGGFITARDLEALAPLVDGAPWYFRPFRGGNCLDPRWDRLGEPSTAESLAARARFLGKQALAPSFAANMLSV